MSGFLLHPSASKGVLSAPCVLAICKQSCFNACFKTGGWATKKREQCNACSGGHVAHPTQRASSYASLFQQTTTRAQQILPAAALRAGHTLLIGSSSRRSSRRSSSCLRTAAPCLVSSGSRIQEEKDRPKSHQRPWRDSWRAPRMAQFGLLTSHAKAVLPIIARKPIKGPLCTSAPL